MKNKKTFREWILFTIMLVFGVFLLQFTASIATTVPENWQISANISSDLDPDQDFFVKQMDGIQPVLPEIMTPPAWDVDTLLTPEPDEYEQAIIVPVADFAHTSTPTSILVSTYLASKPTDQTSQGESELASPSIQIIFSPTPSNPGILVTSTPSFAAATLTDTPGPVLTTTDTPAPLPASATPTPGNGRPTREPKPTKEPGPGNGGGGGQGGKKP